MSDLLIQVQQVPIACFVHFLLEDEMYQHQQQGSHCNQYDHENNHIQVWLVIWFWCVVEKQPEWAEMGGGCFICAIFELSREGSPSRVVVVKDSDSDFWAIRRDCVFILKLEYNAMIEILDIDFRIGTVVAFKH